MMVDIEFGAQVNRGSVTLIKATKRGKCGLFDLSIVRVKTREKAQELIVAEAQEELWKILRRGAN